MGNTFFHDAVPAWSGFIYQGQVAMYLAVKKIRELLAAGKQKNIVESNYLLEIEKSEDIAIVKVDGGAKHYLSIHQVKNQQDRDIASYKKPLTQLMLEKGFWEKQKLGTPEAYLHLSNALNEENQLRDYLNQWKTRIKDFYIKIVIYSKKKITEKNKEIVIKEIKAMFEEDPIGLNRAEYKNLRNGIKDICKKENCDIPDLQKQMGELATYLREELAVKAVNENISLYTYDGETFCDGPGLYTKLIHQIRSYKDNDAAITEGQYNFIADKLLHYMRQYILERHQWKQEKKKPYQSIPFRDVIQILDGSLSDYEKEANILALRRQYDERLSEYCREICEDHCKDNGETDCNLTKPQFAKTGLKDEDFIRLCYGYNPDCDKKISERDCLFDLLNKNGLHESVFEVLKRVPEEYFVKGEDPATAVVRDERENAFLTAISNGNNRMTVNSIAGAIKKNAELVSPIFEADELITARLCADASVWDDNYSDISKDYLSRDLRRNYENDDKSICMPKKPAFIRAGDMLDRLL